MSQKPLSLPEARARARELWGPGGFAIVVLNHTSRRNDFLVGRRVKKFGLTEIQAHGRGPSFRRAFEAAERKMLKGVE